MKLMISQRVRKCGDCGETIEFKEEYYATSYNCYCKKCGEIRLARKTHKDINPTCIFCKEDSVGVLYGKPVCPVHIGKVIPDL
jgi:hypothetical protein